jgi:hypothetical protein
MVCLSRSNIVIKPGPNATVIWDVCFSNDYSAQIGELLADIILRTPSLTADNAAANVTARVLEMETATRAVQFYDIMASKVFRAGFYIGDSCCKTCIKRSYFPYLLANTCRIDPFGNNCCHITCKSLNRLRMGMTIAVQPCCKRLKPTKCKLV